MPGLKIGFIGIGRMGSGMAASLLKAGHKMVVCDANPAAVSALAQKGAQVAESPAEMGSIPGLSVVISMLPSPQHVRDAYFGDKGLFSREPRTLHPSLLIDSSTVDPGTAREVAQAAGDVLLHPDAAESTHRQYPDMIDAPVSGGVPAAANATLTFMCGGKHSAVEAAKPLLLSMGKRVMHCGDHGSGQAAKLANNLVLAISMAAVAEGLAFGEHHGLDPALLTTIFNSSSAHCWSSEKYNPCPGVMEGVPSSRGYQGGFPTALMLKDLDLVIQSGAGTSSETPMTQHVRSLYEKTAQQSGAGQQLDFSSIYRYIYNNNNGSAK